MSVTHLLEWDVTAIEIALDVETPGSIDRSRFVFTGPVEPRICLVAAFALSSQLKRIVAAVHRALPVRPPAGLRIAPAPVRSPSANKAAGISIQPMLALLRLQSKLIRAIEPGLAHDLGGVRMRRDMVDSAARFINDFISRKSLPSFEPPCEIADFDVMELGVIGLTIYRLGGSGTPQSILGHWPYSPDPGSRHLRGGP